MAYPRTDCPVCERDVAVYPFIRCIVRHDPPERDPELKSCPGSFTRQHLDPERHGTQEELF
jgi:hypothetical protein